MADRYLVTGALGCIGAWVLFHLLEAGKTPVSFDLSDDHHRLDLLMSHKEQEKITFVQGDLTDFEQVQRLFVEYGITHVIHLAALQVPACRANPVLGSKVNVTGTVNIFEAAKQSNLKHIAYASSIAAYGPPDIYPEGPLAHDAPMIPATFYGVFKIANEGTARIYWQDYGISSTTLRPYTVYGVARDQGLTSEPTKAMEAAAKGENYHIGFGGRMQFHYASDVARQFILAAEQPLDGAKGFNLGTPAIPVGDVVNLIMKIKPHVTVTFDDKPLPFPESCDASELYRAFGTVYETPLEEGIRQTIAHFERLNS